MYDERFYELMGKVKDILKIVIEDYDVVCIQVGKGMLSDDNEINLYFIKDVNDKTGSSIYKFLSGDNAEK